MLKLFAIIAMVIDHFGASYIEEGIFSISETLTSRQLDWWIALDGWLRVFGRITFPVMAFFIVEGMFKTRDVKKYAIRLGIFALVSEIPFDLATENMLFDMQHQNIFFTLLIGLVAIAIADRIPMQYALVRLVPILAAMVLAYVLKTDYGAVGIVVIALMYGFYRVRLSKEVIGGVFIATELTLPKVGIASLIYVAMMFFYNGERGFNMKYFFYLFYPVHLLILGIILRTQF